MLMLQRHLYRDLPAAGMSLCCLQSQGARGYYARSVYTYLLESVCVRIANVITIELPSPTFPAPIKSTVL